MQKPLLTAALAGLVALCAWQMPRLYAQSKARSAPTVRKLPDPDAMTADATKVGDIPRALRQAQSLMDWYIANPSARTSGKTPPLDLLRLPEQPLIENSDQREGYSFYLLTPHLHPEMPEVIFYSETFVREDMKRTGYKATYNPHGFYIVGYTNGIIRQIPLPEARYYPSFNQKDALITIFPQTKNWRSDLPRLLSVDNSPKNQHAMHDLIKDAGAGADTFKQRWAEDHGRPYPQRKRPDVSMPAANHP